MTSTMSKRELDVLEAIGQGRSNVQIAEELNMTIDTVNKHIKSLKAKTGRRTLIALANHVRGEEFEPAHPALSPREQWIAALIVADGTNKEIAEASNISPQTVKNHLTNMFNKLGVWSRLELVTRLRTTNN